RASHFGNSDNQKTRVSLIGLASVYMKMRAIPLQSGVEPIRQARKTLCICRPTQLRAGNRRRSRGLPLSERRKAKSWALYKKKKGAKYEQAPPTTFLFNQTMIFQSRIRLPTGKTLFKSEV